MKVPHEAQLLALDAEAAKIERQQLQLDVCMNLVQIVFATLAIANLLCTRGQSSANDLSTMKFALVVYTFMQ